mgnify:CR=1 FL=1
MNVEDVNVEDVDGEDVDVEDEEGEGVGASARKSGFVLASCAKLCSRYTATDQMPVSLYTLVRAAHTALGS